MKHISQPAAVLCAALATTTPAFSQETPEKPENDPLNAVVLLEVSTSAPNIFRPWQNRTGGGAGSGVVIGDGRILTCAHCVADSSYIRVRKHNEDSLYNAIVELIEVCHDGFVRLGLDCGDEWDVKMVVDAKAMIEATPRVMARYQIPADRSDDLKKR